MLVTFVLFGHWMETRSRRGTSDALQALLTLVPPKGRVVRNGAVVEVPTGEIRRGDIIELRPEWSALLMSASSIIVATHAVLLKRAENHLRQI